VYRFLLRRFLQTCLLLFVASLISFFVVRLAFDPLARFRIGVRDPEAFQRFRLRLGLDRPLVEQYGSWLREIVRGDFGVSSRTSQDVFPSLIRAFLVSMQLLLPTLFFSFFISLFVGTFSALREHSFFDKVVIVITHVGLAFPPFALGLFLIDIFSLRLQSAFHLSEPLFYFLGLHSSGTNTYDVDYLRHIFLPVATLTLQVSISWIRYQRSAVREILAEDFILAARAKGLSEWKLLWSHGIRNSLGSLFPVITSEATLLLSGMLVTEYIFSIPGIGKEFIGSLLAGDVYFVLGYLILAGFFVACVHLLSDIILSRVNPRVVMLS
jgi:peptide/nickel transport system permease protein